MKMGAVLMIFLTFGEIANGSERKLKVNDEIQLDVFGESELGAVVRIDSSGSVNFPLVGTIEVVGQTPSEVAKIIEHRLEQDYIRDANVTVSVVEEFVEKADPLQARPLTKKIETESITILGEVKQPGIVRFEGKSINILAAIAEASGFSPVANPKKVMVKRMGQSGNPQMLTVNVLELQRGSGSFDLLPGDTVSVIKRIF